MKTWTPDPKEQARAMVEQYGQELAESTAHFNAEFQPAKDRPYWRTVLAELKTRRLAVTA